MRIKRRMVRPDKDGVCSIKCEDCPLCTENNELGKDCHSIELFSPKEAEAIIRTWEYENPIKTYRDVFYEHYMKNSDTSETPPCCRKILHGAEDVWGKHCIGKDCRKCWEEEYQEK